MVKRKYHAVWAADSTPYKLRAVDVINYQPPTALLCNGGNAEMSPTRTRYHDSATTTSASPILLELTKAEVKEACDALRLKQQREKQGRRQYGRKLVSEPFKLSNSQKLMFANCYKSARNAERPVDYVRMSKSCHFNAFKGFPHLLAAMEGAIVAELKKALVDQREIEAGASERTISEWNDEIDRVRDIHQGQVALLKTQVEKLEQDLAHANATITDLRELFRDEEKENLDCDVRKSVRVTLEGALCSEVPASTALEHELQTVGKLKKDITRLNLMLTSCTECGVTGDMVEQFTTRFAVSPQVDVATGKKQRDFTASKMRRLDAIRGAELMRDFDEFAVIRDDLWHECGGIKGDNIDHKYFQALCHKIRNTVGYLEREIME